MFDEQLVVQLSCEGLVEILDNLLAEGHEIGSVRAYMYQKQLIPEVINRVLYYELNVEAISKANLKAYIQHVDAWVNSKYFGLILDDEPSPPIDTNPCINNVIEITILEDIIIIVVEMPGFKVENIQVRPVAYELEKKYSDVSIMRRYITIWAETKSQPKMIFWEKISLSENVDDLHPKFHYQNGLLEVRLLRLPNLNSQTFTE